MSLILVCLSITAARQSHPQQVGDSGDVGIGRMSDVTAGDLQYTFGTFLGYLENASEAGASCGEIPFLSPSLFVRSQPWLRRQPARKMRVRSSNGGCAAH
jgi:hypothetical protein